MNAVIGLGLVLTVAQTTIAEPITNREGKVYQVKQVTRVEPDGITVMHSAGLAKLYFWELPDEYQKKYGYDPEKAAVYNKNATAARAQYSEAVRKFAEDKQRQLSQESETKPTTPTVTGKKVTLKGQVLYLWPQGVVLNRVEFKLAKPKNWQQVNSVWQSRGFDAPMNPHGDDYIAHNALIFIYMSTAGMYEGKSFSGEVSEAGTYSHEGRTLQAYK